MKKTLLFVVVSTMLSTAAVAEDFNKTGVAVSAQGQHFGVSVETGSHKDFADGSRVIGINSNGLPVDVRAEFIEKDSTQDYRLTVGKRAETNLGTSAVVYGVAEAHYTFGDSFTKNELRLSPYAGVDILTGTTVVPFVEAGYDWKSQEGDHTNFSKADSYAKVGARLSINKHAGVVIAVRQEMNTTFDKTDRQAEVKLAVNF